MKFGFTGNRVAITFGPETFDTTLVGYRIDGQDWQFTNVSTGATHLLVNSNTTGVSLTYPTSPSTFEMRVTNWAYGVQIAAVHVKQGEKLIKIPDFPRTIEVIGDSLSAGMYASYEGLSSFAYGLGAGLGNSEYSVTAYPGICLFDKLCWGNPHGMLYQWFRTSDTSWRAQQAFGDNPEWWDFSKKPAADIVVLNLGTNDNNSANNVTAEGYVAQYKMLVQGVHKVYPKAQIILMVRYFPNSMEIPLNFPGALGGLQPLRQHIRTIHIDLRCRLRSANLFRLRILQHERVSRKPHPLRSSLQHNISIEPDIGSIRSLLQHYWFDAA